jgi:predicted GTPase
MGQKFIDGVKILKELKGKDLVLLMGNTGAGKSTLAHALIKLSGLKKKENGRYEAEKMMHNNREVFTIGQEAIGCTGVPSFAPLDENESVFLVDCPGFGDSDESKEVPNMALVHQIIK